MTTPDTIIWISGATEGIGWGLARTVPYANARVINLSRRQHPDLETVIFDLTRPETWDAVEQSFRRELANFAGKRAIFIHNAFFRALPRFMGEGDTANHREEIVANGMAPQILGDMFLRAVKPGYESGLVLMSSAGARSPFEGHSAYCAGKAGVEMWVRVVRRELKRRGRDTWVVALRPGFVDTPTTRAEAKLPFDVYPVGPQMARQLESREGVMTPEEAGVGIWAMLPPKEDKSVLLQGEMVVVGER
ncbi:MAG: SDR family NAD(P)-dependent oxidoreductase [Gammaproteobacteria bacterium]